MKKILCIGMALFTMLLGGCTNKSEPNNVKSEGMTLHIEVEDKVNNKELFNDDVHVEGKVETLTDFLKKADKLQVEMEEDTYGNKIMGIKGVKTEDFNKGPWWIYSSENNASCKEKGQCDAADSLKVKDGDAFTFTFTSTF